MPFPDIDPVLFQIGPIALRWYAVAYILGIALGISLARFYADRYSSYGLTKTALDDFMVWAIAGVIIGGRLGSVLLYNFEYYMNNPIEILQTWKGGMSFHGGLLGVIAVSIWFCWRKGIEALSFFDVISCVAPIGLFFGRIANFLNGELWGRPTELPWGVLFPGADLQPRHPSQLYEAMLEGALLFLVLNIMIRATWVRLRTGLLSGTFLLSYGVIRFFVEYTREPDATLIGPFTRGQAYSIPMLLIGVWLLYNAFWQHSRTQRILGS